MSSLIVSRLGGDAAADSKSIRQIADIIRSDPLRRYVVVSAPGSTHSHVGITDLLYLCHASYMDRENYNPILEKISERFTEIVEGLGVNINVEDEITSLKKSLVMGMSLDHIASRGEYITAKIFAEYLGWEFVDAEGLIFFNDDGSINKDKTFSLAGMKLAKCKHAVIPSFYGSTPDGKIKTFQRGDCDTAGALIACSVDADLFEKWSETAKVYSADPAVVPDPEIIRKITYSEALELNYMGIKIANDNVMFMLRDAGITMKISGVTTPDDNGMLITPNIPIAMREHLTVCIAGRRNFNVIHIYKHGMNKIYSFGETLFGIFAGHHIACQHYLSGIHQMSIILKTPIFDIRRNQIIREIQDTVKPEDVTVEKGLALIAVIGEGMGTVKGIFSRAFSALARAEIKVKMMEQGADSLNMIIGVDDADYVKAIQALYRALVLKEEGE